MRHDGKHDGRHGAYCQKCWDYEHDVQAPWYRLLRHEIRTTTLLAIGFGIGYVLKVLA